MITALRTTLNSVNLTTNLAAATPATMTQPTTAPTTLSGDKLRSMLNASRASGDPVLAGGTSGSTANSAKTVNEAIQDFVAISWRIRAASAPPVTLEQIRLDTARTAINNFNPK